MVSFKYRQNPANLNYNEWNVVEKYTLSEWKVTKVKLLLYSFELA